MSLHICVVSAQNRYNTFKLQNIAKSVNFKNVIDTLPDSCYIGSFTFKNKPLTISVRNGNVEHIGYELFSPRQRVGQLNCIYDFIERQILENDLNSAYTNTNAKAKTIRFIKGNVNTIRHLSGDTAVTVNIRCIHDNRYEVDWIRNDQTLCSLVFPNNRELIIGSTMDENETQLQHKLISYTHAHQDTLQSPSRTSLQPDIYDESLLMRDFGSPRTPYVGHRLFYTLDTDSIPQLVFSSLHPIETTANILCSGALFHDIQATVKLMKYNFKSETFSMPLFNLISFFLQEDCIPYFGLIKYDEATRQIECILEMHNYMLAYEHLMRIKINLSRIDSLAGEAEITLYPYVPTTNFTNDENV